MHTTSTNTDTRPVTLRVIAGGHLTARQRAVVTAAITSGHRDAATARLHARVVNPGGGDTYGVRVSWSEMDPFGRPRTRATRAVVQARRVGDAVAIATCQDCGTAHKVTKLKQVADYRERVASDEAMPAGECPDCGAVAHTPEVGPTLAQLFSS